MLKTEILPTSLLRCTSVICRLRNSGKKMVAIYDKDDVEVETFPVENVNELRQRIKECTCLSDDVSYNQLKYKYVDIHWPIQFLPENVTLVDTPGIADSADMTATVFEYLQHAIAYIYVVNSANAGGVQKDRLLSIIKQQQKLKNEGKLQMFHPELAVFLCNKWEQVPKHEDEIENRLRKNGLPKSEEFQTFLIFLQTMIPATLKGKMMIHTIQGLLVMLELCSYSGD
ncbi:hypothetical protein KUTeg_008448 [Tegillarca granosa]|uniref:Dynamin N-terminal domain-containing protein n=1 Tax=Tegillarca granosa TaxID=220873 RepID=A0ABQ9FDE9_TEGGR|nr:hypothetical protein KUTeg_008448 [Tegillarca granosa]